MRKNLDLQVCVRVRAGCRAGGVDIARRPEGYIQRRYFRVFDAALGMQMLLFRSVVVARYSMPLLLVVWYT